MNKRSHVVTAILSTLTTILVMRVLDNAHFPLAQASPAVAKELTVDRLIVRQELIVSDTGLPWENGFEKHQIPRGAVIRSLADDEKGKRGTAGLWLRSRLIKAELDDPFDDRIHAINRDGTMFRAPGHISWNVWLDDAWRQCAIIQGEVLEKTEIPDDQWSGSNHPGRLRFQSFRPNHGEPLTDAIIGQGKMSLGGGGYGGGGLPYPSRGLQIWGGEIQTIAIDKPTTPKVIRSEGQEPHSYAIVAIDSQGRQSEPSDLVNTNGRATLQWDSIHGADAYAVMRDGQVLSKLLRIEGSNKQWRDPD